MKKWSVAILLTALLFAGVLAQRRADRSPQLSREAAMELVKSRFAAEGYDLTRYRLELHWGAREYTIFLKSTARYVAPGDHAHATVHKQTGIVKVYRGE